MEPTKRTDGKEGTRVTKRGRQSFMVIVERVVRAELTLEAWSSTEATNVVAKDAEELTRKAEWSESSYQIAQVISVET